MKLKAAKGVSKYVIYARFVVVAIQLQLTVYTRNHLSFSTDTFLWPIHSERIGSAWHEVVVIIIHFAVIISIERCGAT